MVTDAPAALKAVCRASSEARETLRRGSVSEVHATQPSTVARRRNSSKSTNNQSARLKGVGGVDKQPTPTCPSGVPCDDDNSRPMRGIAPPSPEHNEQHLLQRDTIIQHPTTLTSSQASETSRLRPGLEMPGSEALEQAAPGKCGASLGCAGRKAAL